MEFKCHPHLRRARPLVGDLALRYGPHEATLYLYVDLSLAVVATHLEAHLVRGRG